VRIEKSGNLELMPIFFALQIVLNQDERLFRRATDSIKFSVRSSLVDRRDFYLGDIQTREMHPRLSKKKVGSHYLVSWMSMLRWMPLAFFSERTIQP
jgi:hypothetical protein